MSDLNAFITETNIEPTGSGSLDDLEVGVKDNISTEGVRTTCGSEMLEEYVPPYDATVVERLRQEGAVIVGKTNMDEFGMGTTTETSAFGPTKNPVDTSRVPGGSSGGSAAAVAAGDVDVALGSDTGGSVRCPAAFCGVVGIKPTYGLVSRYGLVAYANSLEQIGPIAADTQMAARTLDVLAGRDERDPTTREDDGVTYEEATEWNVSDYTVGVVDELVDGADERVVEEFESAVERLEKSGVSVKRISVPAVEKAVAAYYVIAMSEASSNLARFDGIRYGPSGSGSNWNESFADVRSDAFGEEVKRRILLGTYATSAGYHDKYYAKAQDARAWLRQQFNEKFNTVDALASPTMPVLPFEQGEGIEDPMKMYLADANTTPVNLANLPALSVPAGRSEGLPVGMQLIGPAFGERDIIALASELEP